jgi:hypothetical protein
MQGRPKLTYPAPGVSQRQVHRPTLHRRRPRGEPGLDCPVPRRRIPPCQTGTAPPRPLTTRPVLPTLRPRREPCPPAPGGTDSPPPHGPSGARRGPPAPGATRGPLFHFPQKYPAPRPARPGQRATTAPESTGLPLHPSPRDLPYTGRRRRKVRPTLHQPGDEARAREHTSPTGLPYTRAGRPIAGDRVPQRKPPLRRSQPVGRAIGEIEAKDGLPSADRNNKATLLLTGPFRTAKSSAKDLTPLVLKLQYAKYHDALRAPWKNRLLRR